MSVIHYKFKSSLDYDTLRFDGLQISLGELKKEISRVKNFGINPEFDLQIINAQSKETYSNDDEQIPRNASVIVSRIPVGALTKAQAWTNSPKMDTLSLEQLSKTADLASAEASEEDKILAMMKQSTNEYDTSNYQKLNKTSAAFNYRCFRCDKPGHFIQNCPVPPRDVEKRDIKERPQRVRGTTGIPQSFLVPVDDPTMKGAMVTTSGRLAMPAIDKAAYLAGKKEKPPFVKTDSTTMKPKVEERHLPKELTCPLCKDLFTEAVVIACCGDSFCDECIRNKLLEFQDHVCPSCKTPGISPDTLVLNKMLRTAVLNFMNNTGYTKAKKKAASLNGPSSDVLNQHAQKSADSRPSFQSRLEEARNKINKPVSYNPPSGYKGSPQNDPVTPVRDEVPSFPNTQHQLHPQTRPTRPPQPRFVTNYSSPHLTPGEGSDSRSPLYQAPQNTRFPPSIRNVLPPTSTTVGHMSPIDTSLPPPPGTVPEVPASQPRPPGVSPVPRGIVPSSDIRLRQGPHMPRPGTQPDLRHFVPNIVAPSHFPPTVPPPGHFPPVIPQPGIHGQPLPPAALFTGSQQQGGMLRLPPPPVYPNPPMSEQEFYHNQQQLKIKEAKKLEELRHQREMEDFAKQLMRPRVKRRSHSRSPSRGKYSRSRSRSPYHRSPSRRARSRSFSPYRRNSRSISPRRHGISPSYRVYSPNRSPSPYHKHSPKQKSMRIRTPPPKNLVNQLDSITSPEYSSHNSPPRHSRKLRSPPRDHSRNKKTSKAYKSEKMNLGKSTNEQSKKSDKNKPSSPRERASKRVLKESHEKYGKPKSPSAKINKNSSSGKENPADLRNVKSTSNLIALDDKQSQDDSPVDIRPVKSTSNLTVLTKEQRLSPTPSSPKRVPISLNSAMDERDDFILSNREKRKSISKPPTPIDHEFHNQNDSKRSRSLTPITRSGNIEGQYEVLKKEESKENEKNDFLRKSIPKDKDTDDPNERLKPAGTGIFDDRMKNEINHKETSKYGQETRLDNRKKGKESQSSITQETVSKKSDQQKELSHDSQQRRDSSKMYRQKMSSSKDDKQKRDSSKDDQKVESSKMKQKREFSKDDKQKRDTFKDIRAKEVSKNIRTKRGSSRDVTPEHGSRHHNEKRDNRKDGHYDRHKDKISTRDSSGSHRRRSPSWSNSPRSPWSRSRSRSITPPPITQPISAPPKKFPFRRSSPVFSRGGPPRNLPAWHQHPPYYPASAGQYPMRSALPAPPPTPFDTLMPAPANYPYRPPTYAQVTNNPESVDPEWMKWYRVYYQKEMQHQSKNASSRRRSPVPYHRSRSRSPRRKEYREYRSHSYERRPRRRSLSTEMEEKKDRKDKKKKKKEKKKKKKRDEEKDSKSNSDRSCDESKDTSTRNVVKESLSDSNNKAPLLSAVTAITKPRKKKVKRTVTIDDDAVLPPPLKSPVGVKARLGPIVQNSDLTVHELKSSTTLQITVEGTKQDEKLLDEASFEPDYEEESEVDTQSDAVTKDDMSSAASTASDNYSILSSPSSKRRRKNDLESSEIKLKNKKDIKSHKKHKKNKKHKHKSDKEKSSKKSKN